MSICTDTGLVAEQAIERSEWSRPGVMWTNGPSTADGITVEEHSCCLEKESCCLVKGECLPQTSVDGLCSSDTVARDVAVVGGCVETVRTVSTFACLHKFLFILTLHMVLSHRQDLASGTHDLPKLTRVASLRRSC